LAGAKPAGKGEFTMRAFLNGKMDLSQAEAVADMIVADSYGSHKLALEQMRGGYSEHMKVLRQNLLDFASLIELELDFGEEDVEFADRQKLVELIDEIDLKINSLIHTFKHGNAIKQGIPLALVGRPNAGKSTLLNALLQDNRAIVSPEAGTTRDTIEEVLILDGVKFRLIDTAGIRKTDSLVEIEGIKRTFDQVAKAEKVIYLFDPLISSKEEIVADLQELGELEKVWIICNKSDLLSPAGIEEWKTQFPRILFISSKFEKLTELMTELTSLSTKENNQSEITLTNTRHYESLHSASVALKEVKEGLEAQLSGELLAFHINDALDALGQITGNVTNDELLGNIFGRFCIGK
jgi:tRNA modification GTPase